MEAKNIADAMVTIAVNTPGAMTMIEAGDTVEEEGEGDQKNEEIAD